LLVGYGNLYPHTVAGRIIAMGVMLLGVGFLAVLTATVASHFVKSMVQTAAKRFWRRSIDSKPRSRR
jgi:voltage-gated potassium channel